MKDEENVVVMQAMMLCSKCWGVRLRVAALCREADSLRSIRFFLLHAVFRPLQIGFAAALQTKRAHSALDSAAAEARLRVRTASAHPRPDARFCTFISLRRPNTRQVVGVIRNQETLVT